MDETDTTVADTETTTDNDVIISIDSSDSFAALDNTMLDTITISDLTNMANSTYNINPSVASIWTMAGSGSVSTVTIPSSSGYYGNLTLNGNSITSSYNYPNSWTIGDQDTTKNKIYIVEPWQSKNPIQVEDGLWISLEKDLISNEKLKQKIMEKLEETNPEIVIKMGINPDNMKLVKREVNLEIHPDSEKKDK